MSKIKNSVALLAFLLGCLLLIANGAGFFIGSVAENDPTDRKPVLNYDYRTLAWTEANRQFLELLNNNIPPEGKAKSLYGLVSKSFIHTPSYNKIKLWENWMLWLAGTLFNRHFFKSQDPDFLWKRGGGHCSQASIIFVAKGKDLGLKTRLIGLSGHVVAEVYLPEKGWRVVDPDMGIFWNHDLDSFGVNPSEEQVRNELLALGYSEKLSRRFSQVYVSQENNFRKEYPSSPNRFLLEKVLDWAKWLLPLGLVAVGLVRWRLLHSDNYTGFRVKSLKERLKEG